MKGKLEEESLSSSPNKFLSRAALLLSFLSLVERALVVFMLFAQPSFADVCPGAPLGTWSMVLLVFCLAHWGFSDLLDWTEKRCAPTALATTLLRVLLAAALLAAAGWIAAGHMWVSRAWNCVEVGDDLYLHIASLGVCDAAFVFCLVVAGLGWLHVSEDEDEKERRRLFR